ncbi:hypothetical protein Ahy_B01g055128 isoform D [Arachis hypogaea]|uniref:Uncharacterized protein n=1 Tax=Arachis hypogaea TaxID=3818 RepID=A0A445AV74_ARAHY|nr:hypothetical protein Ahy_B01g055128 isoform D [Arachis hypogaea]
MISSKLKGAVRKRRGRDKEERATERGRQQSDGFNHSSTTERSPSPFQRSPPPPSAPSSFQLKFI